MGSMGLFQGNQQGMLYCIRTRNCGEPFPPLHLQQLRREHLEEPREKGATKPEPQPTFHPRHQAGRELRNKYPALTVLPTQIFFHVSHPPSQARRWIQLVNVITQGTEVYRKWESRLRGGEYPAHIACHSPLTILITNKLFMSVVYSERSLNSKGQGTFTRIHR